MRCSHILNRVHDLDAAMRDFRAAGFTVQAGRRTRSNALIWFETGPFVELLGVAPPMPRALRPVVSRIVGAGVTERLTRWRETERGWCDVAVETDDPSIGAERDRLVAAGVATSAPRKFRRTEPGGRKLRWEITFPGDANLPFAMSAYTPDPRPQVVAHANGATGVHAVRVEIPTSSRRAWDVVVDTDDPWFDVAAGPRFAVTSVTVTGLRKPLPDSLTDRYGIRGV